MWYTFFTMTYNMPRIDHPLFIDGLLFTGILLLLQWFLLRPKSNWHIRLSQTGRPFKSAVIAASFFAAILTFGAVATILELPDLWGNTLTQYFNFYTLQIPLAITWLFWTIIFYSYWRKGDRYTQLTRMIRGLIAGSILELLVAAPVQAMTYHRNDCYCDRGSYAGLIFAGTVLTWVFGPGVILLFMREKYRHEKLAGMYCLNCNYDLRGTIAASGITCPECGKSIQNQTKYVDKV